MGKQTGANDWLKNLTPEQYSLYIKAIQEATKQPSTKQPSTKQPSTKLPSPPQIPKGIGASNLPGKVVRKPLSDLELSARAYARESARQRDISEAFYLEDIGALDVEVDDVRRDFDTALKSGFKVKDLVWLRPDYDEDVAYNLSDEEDKELDFMIANVLSKYQHKGYVGTDDDAIKDLNKSFRKYGIIFSGHSGQIVAQSIKTKETVNVDLNQLFISLFSREGYFGLAPLGSVTGPNSEERKAANELKAFIKKNALPPEAGSSSAEDQLAFVEYAKKANYNPEQAAKVRDDYERYTKDIKALKAAEELKLSPEKIKAMYGTDNLAGLIKAKEMLRDKISPIYNAIKAEVLDPADLYLEKQVQNTNKLAVKKAKELESEQAAFAKEFYDRYKMEFNEKTLNAMKFYNQQEFDEFSAYLNRYNIIIKKAGEVNELVKQSDTFLSAKHDKAIKQEYVGNLRGALNSFLNGWNTGEKERVLEKAKGELILNTMSEEDRREYSARLNELMNKPERPVSVLQYRVYKAMQDGDFGNFLNTITDSPLSFISAVTTMAGESLAQMIATSGREMAAVQAGATIIGAAAGAIAGKNFASARAGGSIGYRLASGFNATVGNVGANLALETSAAMLSALEEKYTAEDVLSGKWIDDPEIMEKAFNHGLKRGIPISATELIAAGLLSKFKVSSIASAPKRVAAAMARASVIEPVTESLGEGVAQIVSGEGFNAIETVAEGLGGIGMIASNPFGFGKMIYDQVRTDYYTNLADNMSKSRAFINNTGDNISRVQEWASNMRSTGQITEETERKIIENVADIRQARIALSALDDTDAQRTKTIEKGTQTKIEDRLADLYAAKRKLDRTPQLNKPLQQSIQNEIDHIVLNKKLLAKEHSLNLSPIIGTGPVYKVNGEYVGKRYIDKLIDAMPPSVLSKMNIQVENDNDTSNRLAGKIEEDVSFNVAEYSDDKITFVAESKEGLPRRFREMATRNESTGKYEVEVDKSEMGKPTEDVSDADYEAFKQGNVSESVLESIADSISEGRRPTARQREIFNANKDAVNAKVGSDYVAVDPLSTYQQAAQEVAKGKTVYAKSKKTGKVYSVSNKVALDTAYKSGARILMSKPMRKVAGEFKKGKFQRTTTETTARTWKSEQEKKAFKDFATRIANRIGARVLFLNDDTQLYKGYYDPVRHTATINLAYADSETLWHEILGHPVIAAIRYDEKYAELYNNLSEEINNTELGREIYQNVQDTYKFNDPEDTMEEAIVQLLGMMSDKEFKKKENAKLLSLLKELLKEMADWVRTALRKDGITIDDFPANATIGDIAKILGIGNKKVLLPGQYIEYKTPTGLNTSNYADVQDEIAALANGSLIPFFPDVDEIAIEEANLATYPENSVEYIEAKNRYRELIKEAIQKLSKEGIDIARDESYVDINDPFTGESYLSFYFKGGKIYVTNLSSDYNLDLELTSGGTKEISFSKFIEIHDSSKRVRDYIHHNTRFSIGRQIVDQYIEDNDIVYDPQEAYSLGYGFQHQIGLYGAVDDVNLLQNMLQLLDDNESSGAEYILSCATMNMANFSKFVPSLRIILYPQPSDIKWAADKDVYSGSLAESYRINPGLAKAVDKGLIEKNRAKSLAGVSLAKYPSPSMLSGITPDIIGAVATVNPSDDVHGNEIGIKLNGNNWRVSAASMADSRVKEMADRVNKMLDEKYGPVTEPNYGNALESPNADNINIDGKTYEVIEYTEDIDMLSGNDNSFYIVKDPDGIDKVNKLEQLNADVRREMNKIIKDLNDEGFSFSDVPDDRSGKAAIAFFHTERRRAETSASWRWPRATNEKIRTLQNYVNKVYELSNELLNKKTKEISGEDFEHILGGPYKGSAKVYKWNVTRSRIKSIQSNSKYKHVNRLTDISGFKDDGETTAEEMALAREMMRKGYVKIDGKKYAIKQGADEAKKAADIAALRKAARKYPRVLISSSVQGVPVMNKKGQNAVRFQLIGQNALLRDGVRAELDEANQMERDNRTPLEILMETGWQRGVDGLWRYEILDGKYNKPNKPGTYRLSEVYDSPYLYEVYPFLADVDVTIGDLPPGYRGQYRPIEEGIKMLPSEGIETLVHEIQHAIQGREGFARGSNESLSSTYATPLFKIQREIIALDEQYNFREWLHEGNLEEGVSVDELRQRFVDEQLDGKNYAQELLNKKQDILNQFPDKKLSDIYSEDEMALYNDYDAYYRTAGEVEARNIASRLGMSAEMRRRTLLQQTVRDVAPEDQILLGVGEAVGSVRQTLRQIVEEKLGARGDIEVVPVFEDDDFADWESQDKAKEIAKKSGIRILRGKSLSAYTVNLDDDVTGALWAEITDGKFSFDIAVDEDFRNMGVGEKLLQEAFEQFNFSKDVYEDLSYEVDVTNPVMERMLSRYGFVVDRVVQGHTIMTHPTNNPKKTMAHLSSDMGEASQEYVEKVLSAMMDKFNVPYQIVNDPSDSRLGWTNWDSHGKPEVFVNMANKVGFDTPLHEYGHVFINMIINGNKHVWSEILKELKYGDGAKELERVKLEYPSLKGKGQLVEAAVSLLGKYAAGQLDPKTGEYRLAEKIWDAVKKTINYFLKSIGSNYQLDVSQIPANINAASTLQMLSLLLADPDIKNITGGGLKNRPLSFTLSMGADALAQSVNDPSKMTVVYPEESIIEPSVYVFDNSSMYRFKTMITLEASKATNKLIEAMSKDGGKQKILDVLDEVLDFLTAKKDRSYSRIDTILTDSELGEVAEKFNKLKDDGFKYYKDFESFLKDLILVHHVNLEKQKHLVDKSDYAAIGKINSELSRLNELLSGIMFDDVHDNYKDDKKNWLLRTILNPLNISTSRYGAVRRGSPLVFQDIIDAIKDDKITKFTYKDKVNEDLLDSIARNMMMAIARRDHRSDLHRYSNEMTIPNVTSYNGGDPDIESDAGVYHMQTNLGDFYNLYNRQDMLQQIDYSNMYAHDDNLKYLQQAVDYEKSIVKGIYRTNVSYISLHGGSSALHNVPAHELVRNALQVVENARNSNNMSLGLLSEHAVSKTGSFEYDNTVTNTREKIQVEGVKDGGNIHISFRNSGPSLSMHEDTGMVKIVMPLVLKKIIELFAGEKYNSVSFSPVDNSGKTDPRQPGQKDKVDFYGNKINNRQILYNLYAIRLFGEYSLVASPGIAPNNTPDYSHFPSNIPIPHVFKNEVLKNIQQDQRGRKAAPSSNSDWAANSAPSKVVELAKFLNHAFPGVEVFMDAEEFNRMRESGELDMVGEVYGMTKNGKIYINPEVHDSESEMFNTLIHEFGHIWLNYIKVHNNALYTRGVELVKETKEYKAELAKGKSPDQAADEALAIIIGNRGAEVVNPKLKNWLKAAWKYITKYLGPIETMTLDDFINTALSDLLSGKPIPQSSEAFEATLISEPQFRDDRDIVDVVIEARDRGYTDDAIKRYLENNDYEKDDINTVLSILPDVFTGITGGQTSVLPPSFANVEGGVIEGLAMYNRIRDLAYNAYRLKDRKVTQEGKKEIGIGDRIVDVMANALKEEPAFMTASPAMKKQLMVDLLKSSDATVSKGIRNWITRETAAAKNLKAGGVANADLQRKFRAFIISSLPKTEYTKSEVKALFGLINELTDTNKEQIKDEVLNKVTEIKNSRLIKSIDELIKETKTTKIESGRLKGKVSIDVQDFMDGIEEHFMSADSSPAQIEDKIAELVRDIASFPLGSPQEAAMGLAIKYNSALLMENSDDGKVIALKEVYDDIKGTLKYGRVIFKEESKQRAARHNAEKQEAVFDLSGGKINVDFNDTKAVENTKREVTFKSLADKSSKIAWFEKMVNFVGFFFRYKEDIHGLIERMSLTTAEFFEGKMKALITDRIRSARNENNRLESFTKMMITSNAERIFGKNWKKIVKQNSKRTVEFIIDGIRGKVSQNELYYLYNQYKNPANHPSFETALGTDYKDIMDDLMKSLDPKVKEWADWQVDVFFPTMYPIYNDVYMRIYRTRMPQSILYAGRLAKEGGSVYDQQVTIDIFDPSKGIESAEAMGAAGGQSTKVRTKNKAAIKLGLDGDMMLRVYAKDMNFFASFGEALRDMGRILSDPLVQEVAKTYSGEKNFTALRTLFTRLYDTGFGKKEQWESLLTGVSNFSTAKLGFNPRIYLQQASTFVGYIPFIGYRNYSKWAAIAFKDKFLGKSAWNEIISNSDYLYDRFSKSNIQQLIGGFSNSRDADNFSWYPDGWVDKMLYLVKEGDKAGVAGCIPNYLYFKDKFKSQGMTEQEAIAAAVKKIEEQTKKVAQSNEIEDKDMLQSDHPVLRSFGLFLSQPSQYLRLEMYALRNMYRILLKGGQGAKGNFKQNLRAFMTYHFISPLIFQYVFGSGMPGILSDWDDEDKEDLKWAAILGNLNAVFVLGDLLVGIKEVITDKPWASKFANLPIFMGLQDTIEHLQNYMDAKKRETKQKHLVKFIASLGDLTGIPAGVLTRYAYNIDALINNENETFGQSLLRLLNFSEYSITGPPPNQKKKKKKTGLDTSSGLKESSELESSSLD